MNKVAFSLFVLLVTWGGTMGCDSNGSLDDEPIDDPRIVVVANDVPFPTQDNLRIGYTLRFWEFEREGFELLKIVAIDHESGKALLTLETDEIPRTYSNPVSRSTILPWDEIEHYYLSIQLAIPLDTGPPRSVSHQLTFDDTVRNRKVLIESAYFRPRLDNSPVVIASPLRGDSLALMNQSTMGYHFFTLIFIEGHMYTSERYAFDSIKFSPSDGTMHDGRPNVNESYYNWADTLYAVADGMVYDLSDGMDDLNGDEGPSGFTDAVKMAGNYLTLSLNNGLFANYGHIKKGSFLVSRNAMVREGDPLALLGNSGNSSGPHLHFQLTEGPDFFRTYGVPFVLKQFVETRRFDMDEDVGPPLLLGPTMAPLQHEAAMMEWNTLVRIR